MLNKASKLTVAYFILLYTGGSALAANKPEIRGLDFNPISIQNNSPSPQLDVRNYMPEEPRPVVPKGNDYTESSATLKGNVSDLSATVGKSQLIRFDEPIKRLSLTNPALADLVLLSPREMLINGKAPGVTSLIVWGENNTDPVFFDLSVKNDPTLLMNAIKSIIPDEDINLRFTNDSNVILSGKISSTLKRDKIKSLTDTYGFKLVDLSETAIPQVMVEVKIAEASRNFTKILDSNFSFGPQMPDSLKSAAGYVKSSVLPDGLTGSSGGGLFSGTMNGYAYFPAQRFAYVLTSAENKGFVKILAEPKLMSSNGNKASFNAGQQVPVPSSIGQGGNVAYDMKNIGINVNFTPTIQEGSGKIMLNIDSEVSEIDSTITQGTNYGFKTRKASTTVQLNDGQTLVIAGLIKKKDDQTTAEVPLFGNLPIIGPLFRNAQTMKEDTELLIIVTPHLILQDKPIEGV